MQENRFISCFFILLDYCFFADSIRLLIVCINGAVSQVDQGGVHLYLSTLQMSQGQVEGREYLTLYYYILILKYNKNILQWKSC